MQMMVLAVAIQSLNRLTKNEYKVEITDTQFALYARKKDPPAHVIREWDKLCSEKVYGFFLAQVRNELLEALAANEVFERNLKAAHSIEEQISELLKLHEKLESAENDNQDPVR